ncbi:MAG TPA: HEAT repeat domain-containing protein, partial [Gemmataceae bacterium]|nr:HEAT repeat domain-containing protein [Gemmataceae bacterium]
MNSEIAKLLELARSGQPDPFQQLVHTLRREGEKDVEALLDYLEADDETLRRAAVAAAQGRTEPEVLDAVADLAHDPSPTVRLNLAYALGDVPAWPLDSAVEQLLLDTDVPVRQASVWAARRRPVLHGLLLRRLFEDDNIWVRIDVANALADVAARAALPALVSRLAEDSDVSVQQACADVAERHLAALGGYPKSAPYPQIPILAEARRRVRGFT